MEKPWPSFAIIPLVTISFLFVVAWKNGNVVGQQFPAMFVFGDSLVDCGNNNYISSLARANYLPYGIDFLGAGPTGRFCNGKTIIDFLGDLLGLPLLPPFANTFTDRRDILMGVNYASAAAGILNESGKNLGDRFSLSQQVQNFKTTLDQLKNIIMDERKLQQHLAKSLVVVNIGSNDSINNYLMPSAYSSSSNYNPQQYADLLINHYTSHIMEVYNLGTRKFLLAAIGPLGCMPNQPATGLAPPGKCVAYVNDMAQAFNTRLIALVDQLNSNYTEAAFVYATLMDWFSVTDRGCCGIGRNTGQITCLPFSIPCFDRDLYIFWDAYHPSQAFNEIVARRAYSGGSSDCYPMNVKQMALV